MEDLRSDLKSERVKNSLHFQCVSFEFEESKKRYCHLSAMAVLVKICCCGCSLRIGGLLIGIFGLVS